MSEPPFFIAGDMLPPNTPSYVTRSADQDLSASVLEGAFCYVLTARQMGKSSLMVRTASRLNAGGVRVVSIDLRTITPVLINEWYLELLVSLQRTLHLGTDARAWWNTQAGLGAPQRFIDFLHDVVLKDVKGNIALFFDEIDAMLALDFRDDFFAAIRAMYNARASDSAYKRLTFVLFGVATPTDLIKDLKRTPFNIGRAIELQEFKYAEVAPLRQGLERRYAGQSDRILKRIFYWTNGHPYLTQKLCLAAAQTRGISVWDADEVDALVMKNFFGAATDRDTNLTFVRDKVLGAPTIERRQMLDLYSAVYRGQSIADDDSSPVQNHLELYGLVRVEKGKLEVRNEIYKQVFAQDWIERHAVPRSIPPPPNPPTGGRTATLLYAVLGVLLAIVIGGSAYALLSNSSNLTASAQTATIVAQATGTAEQIGIAATETVLRQSPTGSTLVPTTPAVVLTTPTSERTTSVPIPQPTDTSTPTPEPPTPTPTPTPEPPTPTPTQTPEPPTPTPTPTPEPPTVAPVLARCTVVNPGGVTVRSSPDSSAGRVGALEGGATFQPTAKNTASLSVVWVRVPSPAGWVYAGSQGQRLVSCTALDSVPTV